MLFVNDCEFMLQSHQLLLKDHFEVTIAENGLQGVQIVSTEKDFDVIVMDLNMPIMDGWKASHLMEELFCQRLGSQKGSSG